MTLKQKRIEKRRRKALEKELAWHSPLLESETRAIARKIKYDADEATRICSGLVVPFEPRETFPERLNAQLSRR